MALLLLNLSNDYRRLTVDDALSSKRPVVLQPDVENINQHAYRQERRRPRCIIGILDEKPTDKVSGKVTSFVELQWL